MLAFLSIIIFSEIKRLIKNCQTWPNLFQLKDAKNKLVSHQRSSDYEWILLFHKEKPHK